MNWKFKCMGFYMLQGLPRGAYRWLQRSVTKRYADTLDQEVLDAYGLHVELFRSLPPGSTAFEFGAGRNLLTPLLLSAAGAKTVYTYDVVKSATVEDVNNAIGQLRRRGMPGEWQEVSNLEQDLFDKYRIKYVAPGDARNTGLPAGSIDFVCSTSTLEHIPEQEIVAILAECRRICSARARLSMIVDYHDHYATSDPSITRFNFYRYSGPVWWFFNPRNHYQNRLRHSDYAKLFRDFVILKNEAIVPADQDKLHAQPVHRGFSGYSSEDLLALNGVFVLSPATEAGAQARP